MNFEPTITARIFFAISIIAYILFAITAIENKIYSLFQKLILNQ